MLFPSRHYKIAVAQASSVSVSGAMLIGKNGVKVCVEIMNALLAGMEVHSLEFPSYVVGEKPQQPTVLLIGVCEGRIVCQRKVFWETIHMEVFGYKQLLVVANTTLPHLLVDSVSTGQISELLVDINMLMAYWPVTMIPDSRRMMWYRHALIPDGYFHRKVPCRSDWQPSESARHDNMISARSTCTSC